VPTWAVEFRFLFSPTCILVTILTEVSRLLNNSSYPLSFVYRYIQGDQKVSVHLMITIQKVTSNVQSVPRRHLFTRDGDTRLTLTPSVIPNSNYIIMVSDWNCLKYLCVFLYCNNQVHRDFLVTLYVTRKRSYNT
jgi:hypothetical protein